MSEESNKGKESKPSSSDQPSNPTQQTDLSDLLPRPEGLGTLKKGAELPSEQEREQTMLGLVTKVLLG